MIRNTFLDEDTIALEEMKDPAQIASFRARREQFDRNWEWFKAQAPEVYKRYRGKCLCIAGRELFVGDTVDEVLAMAKAAHPHDNGRFTRYIPGEKAYRVYAITR